MLVDFVDGSEALDSRSGSLEEGSAGGGWVAGDGGGVAHIMKLIECIKLNQLRLKE